MKISAAFLTVISALLLFYLFSFRCLIWCTYTFHLIFSQEVQGVLAIVYQPLIWLCEASPHFRYLMGVES